MRRPAAATARAGARCSCAASSRRQRGEPLQPRRPGRLGKARQRQLYDQRQQGAVAEELLADQGQQVPAQQGRQQQPLRLRQHATRLLQLLPLQLLLACRRRRQAGQAPEAASEVAAVLLQRGGRLDADRRVAIHRVLERPAARQQQGGAGRGARVGAARACPLGRAPLPRLATMQQSSAGRHPQPQSALPAQRCQRPPTWSRS
jgi:hypothetical protein